MNEFRDNVVVLTGASRGIGRELALQLADQGARLALSARDTAALDEVAELCRARGGQAVAIPADVRRSHSARHSSSGPSRPTAGSIR